MSCIRPGSKDKLTTVSGLNKNGNTPDGLSYKLSGVQRGNIMYKDSGVAVVVNLP